MLTAALSLLALIAAAAASWSLLKSADPWRSWRRFAERGGLSVVVPMPDGDPQLAGSWRGLTVRVVCEQGPGRTLFQARIPEGLPCALTIRPRRDPAAALPEGAIASGWADLDRRFIFRSGEPEALSALLGDAAVREALSILGARHPEALLEDGVLRFHIAGQVLDPAALEAALDDLVAPLRAMRRAAEPPAADTGRLEQLASPALSEAERRLILDGLGGELLSFAAVVERVAATTALALDADYREGRTLYAAAGALQLAVRFPASRSAELDGLHPGEALRVRARVSGWDALTRRLTLIAP